MAGAFFVWSRTAAMTRFVLTLQPLPGAVDEIKALRWVLKRLLRQHGLKCIGLQPVHQTRNERRSTARLGSRTKTRRISMIDTRKYGVGAYLKAADIDGTVVKRIINVTENEGKFGPQLDLWFEDGTRISLFPGSKNVRELQRAYGMESDLWLDKAVGLAAEDYVNNDGNPAKRFVLTAVDPEVPREERPKLTTSVPQEKPRPKEEPPPKKANGNKRSDMDDEIPSKGGASRKGRSNTGSFAPVDPYDVDPDPIEERYR